MMGEHVFALPFFLSLIIGIIVYTLMLMPYSRAKSELDRIYRTLDVNHGVEASRVLASLAERLDVFRRVIYRASARLVSLGLPPWLAVRIVAVMTSVLISTITYAMLMLAVIYTCL